LKKTTFCIFRSGEKEAGSVEIAPNIIVELNDKGELTGVEVLEASRFVQDTALESRSGSHTAVAVSRPRAE